MKLNIKTTVLAAAVTIITATTSFAQFKGNIEFSKHVGNIEVNYKYYVDGDNIRVEEINEGAIEGIQIMNLKKETIHALSPERKMYMDVPNKRPATKLDVEVKETGKTKEIKGKKCVEIVVTSKIKDRKIVYWVTKGDYNFFIPMLKTLNRKENQSMFFLEIPNAEGMFPMHSIEYTLSDGKVISELKAEKITKTSVDANKFQIPAGYKKFER